MRFNITPTVKLLLIINIAIFMLFQVFNQLPGNGKAIGELVYYQYFSLHKSNLFGFRSELTYDGQTYFVDSDAGIVDPESGVLERFEPGKDYAGEIAPNELRGKIDGLADTFNPLQILTHFFNHGGFSHLLFNMIALFFLGPLVEMVLGKKRFMNFYLFSGLVGGMFIAFLDPSNGIVVGASGALSGVLFAFAYYFPDRELYLYFLFPVKAKWLAFVYFAFSVIMVWREVYGFGNPGNISHFGHLSGMVAAYLYFRLAKVFPALGR